MKTKSPLIHCITNPISINQCANAILSLGARPIMAEHPKEVQEITATADGLLINLGNITDARMESMELSFREALKNGIPTVIDAVGVACSSLRRKYLKSLLENGSPTLIKGNYSEITALFDDCYTSTGVDSDKALSSGSVKTVAEKLSLLYSTTILASGQTDIIAYNGKSVVENGGTPLLAHITGTGCMLGAICACFLSVCESPSAVSYACRFFKKCGKNAESPCTAGDFQIRLFNNIGGSKKTFDPLLYFITDSTQYPEDEFLMRVEKALMGGVTLVQLREKDKTTVEYIDIAKKVHSLTKKYSVPLIIDDRIDVALAIGAEGVHLGQSDMPIALARKILGDSFIIGATAKTVSQAKEACEEGADYLGVGAIYPTTTKVKTVLTSASTLDDICNAVPIPVNAIGGLNKDNTNILEGIPVSGICVVSAIMKSENPESAARELLGISEKLTGRNKE